MRVPNLAISSACIIVALSACAPAGNESASQDLFESCAEEAGGLLRLDGSTVLLEILGEDAKMLAQGTGFTEEELTSGEMPDISVQLHIIAGMNCLAHATSYPGTAEQLKTGETWNGWTFSETLGTGSESTSHFQAGPNATVALLPQNMDNEEIYTALGCADVDEDSILPQQHNEIPWSLRVCNKNEHFTNFYDFPDVATRDGVIEALLVPEDKPSMTYIVGQGPWVLETTDPALVEKAAALDGEILQ